MRTAIEFGEITKTFGGTVALESVSLSVEEGECHALMGENGAGKSTLGKILAGIHRPDSGTVRLYSTPARFTNPRDARQAGIGMVHQELTSCPDLSVAENLSLGRYPHRFGFLLDRVRLLEQARRQLHDIAPEIDPARSMRDLSVAQNQLVQIAAAVATGANILIFDEPTSALSEGESARLFALLQRLRQRGVTIIYVSHRMSEVFQLCDRISVLRDGKLVGTLDRDEANQETIIRMMIGRHIEEYFPAHLENEPGKELLRVEHLSSPGKFEDVSFSVRAGEIVGFAGLVGSGRSEVAQTLFGLDRKASGSVALAGSDLSRSPLRTRMKRGMALVPEDRKRQGLALMLSCRLNFSLTILERIRKFFFLSRRLERQQLDTYFSRLKIKAASYDSLAASLSGGNQQKIVLAKWLARDSRLLILDEPTRGVDVGAKAAIHALIDELASQGLGIILISSELPEVLNLSTRILVMHEGRVVGKLQRREATQELLLRMMSGLETLGRSQQAEIRRRGDPSATSKSGGSTL
ncbi:MAG: sugar ABC transporter ATP-binding protein [Bacteroidota bacterium]